MSTPNRDAGEWQATGDDPLATPTQFARDRDEYLGETALDVGRQTGANEYELFVSADPAPAMQQQFERLRPEFIAVHDVGTTSSLKLLASLAAASGRSTKKLVIRRQGYGTALATVHFVELPSPTGAKLRMYSTDCDTEAAWQQSLAHTLLAFGRLGVIMVGDLKGNDIALALGRLRDSMLKGPWHNHQLLLLPLGSASGLVSHGMELVRGTDVNVRTTPQVTRGTDAWGFISSTWNRLSERNRGQGRPPVAAAGPPAVPVTPAPSSHGGVSSMPPPEPLPRAPAERQRLAIERAPTAGVGAPSSHPATAELLRRYVRQISELSGVVACTVFDVANGNRVAYAGAGTSATALAAQGAQLFGAIAKAGNALSLGQALPEAAITLESHHLLLRTVPRHPGLALHALLDKAKANLTLVRLQVLRMDALFDDPD